LPQELPEREAVAGPLGVQALDREVAHQIAIPHAIDPPHPAAAEWLDLLVAAGGAERELAADADADRRHRLGAEITMGPAEGQQRRRDARHRDGLLRTVDDHGAHVRGGAPEHPSERARKFSAPRPPDPWSRLALRHRTRPMQPRPTAQLFLSGDVMI